MEKQKLETMHQQTNRKNYTQIHLASADFVLLSSPPLPSPPLPSPPLPSPPLPSPPLPSPPLPSPLLSSPLV